jgi:hypothetical protein
MRHRYLINTKRFRVYLRGSFSWLEINLGQTGRWELVFHLFPFRLRLNRP